MNWTKVDAEHMPPVNTIVHATVVFERREPTVITAMYSLERHKWTRCEIDEAGGTDTVGLWKSTKVTHWMPYPAPAQD